MESLMPNPLPTEQLKQLSRYVPVLESGYENYLTDQIGLEEDDLDAQAHAYLHGHSWSRKWRLLWLRYVARREIM